MAKFPEGIVIRIFFLSIVLLLAVASGAMAADQGFYFGLSAGGNLAAGEAENTSLTGSFNFSYAPGYMGSLALGYRLAPNSPIGDGRVELELGYRTNPLDQIEFSDGKFDADGDATAISLMLNAYGEYPESDGPLIPYVGIGVGVATVSLEGFELAGDAVVDDSDTVFAYQLAAGVDYPLSKRLVLDFGYRFFGTLDPELTDALGETIETEYQVHSFQLGLRF